MNLFATVLLAAAASVPSPAPAPQLPAVPAVAPGYAAPNVSPPPPSVVGVTQQPFVGITLENAIGMALSRNPDLAVAQANRRIASYQIQAAKGAYDVRFMVEPQYQYVTQAPQNEFFAGPNFAPIVQRNSSVATGVQGILPGGQQYSVTASGKQTYDNTQINTFNPTYPTIFSVNFSQPLGKNRAVNATTRALQLAQINAQASDAQTLAAASATISRVQKTYWDLVAAWRNVAIQEQALKDTITQQHSNVRLARQGVSAPIDVVQTNAQIAVFQENVFSALQNVALLQNELKSELVADPNDALWSANLVPTTPALQLPQQPSLGNLVTQALANRPEIAQIRSLRSTADVNLAYAENQTKPQVNLNLGYTSNGFAGTAVPTANSPFLQSSIAQFVAINQLIAAVNSTLPPAQQIPALPNTSTPVPAYLQGGLDQSIKNLLSNKFPVYAAGIQVTFPIGNRTAKADLAAAQEQERSVAVQEASTIQRITMDVRNALQAYQSAQARLLAARAAREASEQVLASEQRRFHAGASTTFLVLQREIELADNRGRELQAQTDLNKAVVDLARATGTILTSNNVNVTTVGEGALKP
ncbi:MAG TPA: TolC family protein [Candidatus Baltobacteraceae bacterium]|nr:TolC family protein [Candidatus Baltobacteraceae bacterium]